MAGGHGAGLVNMLFAPRSATVIEFEHEPHVDRVFGSIAMALGLDYWLVPELSAPLFRNYTMTSSGVHAVLKLVQHVVRSRRLNIWLPTPTVDDQGDPDVLVAVIASNIIMLVQRTC